MPHPQFQAKTQIGHIHLTVSDLEISLAFTRDLLGFEVTQWYGRSAVFLSAGGYHHYIGLNIWGGGKLTSTRAYWTLSLCYSLPGSQGTG